MTAPAASCRCMGLFSQGLRFRFSTCFDRILASKIFVKTRNPANCARCELRFSKRHIARLHQKLTTQIAKKKLRLNFRRSFFFWYFR